MRTTVDLDPVALESAKRLAHRTNRTLGDVLSEALAAYVSRRPEAAADPPFELIVRGSHGARFPSPDEMARVEEAEELGALRIPGRRQHVDP